LLGYTDAALLDELVEAVAARDGAAVFELVDRVVESGHDPRRFATDLLERFRDLVVLSAVSDAGAKGLIDAPDDLLERMAEQASRFGLAELSRAAEVLHVGLTEMRGTTTPRLLLELMCARLLLPSAATDDGATLARLDRLERRLEIGGTAPVESSPASEVTPMAITPTAPAMEAIVTPSEAGALDAAAVRRVWPEILDAAKGRRRTTHALLAQHATVVEVRGQKLVVAIEHAPLLRQFDMGGNAAVLAAALRDVLGVDWQVETVAGAGGPAAADPVATPEGFAPGDAPAEAHTGAGSESDAEAGPDDAISLLTEGLGAQVIGEVDAT
jgi:DNA polymerase-3 subunit gamma/tau